MPETVLDADDYADDSWACRLCAAPGGFPYCNDACRDANQSDTDGDHTFTFLAIDTRQS